MRKMLPFAALLASAVATPALARSDFGPPANPTFQLAGTPISHTFTSYSFNFTATSALTNLTFAFRDDPAFLILDNVSLSSAGGPNLLVNGNFELGPVGSQAPTGWTYVNQYGASEGGIVRSGVGVGGTNAYYDGAIGAYDAITQGVATVAGNLYSVSFALNENGGQTTYRAVSTSDQAGINLAVYAQSGIPTLAGAAPEPGTWAMMILGFGIVGGALRRRRQGALRMSRTA